ncbi:unnamed protein product, partial [Schistosoma margrebowiei]
WQFLLELLLSNKYEHIIRWTNKRGEFILVQAEIVAKLWGMRKDKNHRMNYDKLSRALRYYYQKNIIRKVHGRKFVYQFIGLKNLIKFCCTSMNSTPITTSMTTSIITPTIMTSTLQQTLTPLNNLPIHSKIDNIDLPVTSSLYHTTDRLNELYNHNQKQHQDWFYIPSHNTKFYENQYDCKHTTTSNTTDNILNTITNMNNCTLTSTQTDKAPDLNCSTNNLIHFPNNLDITTITTFINSYLNKNNYETNTITNNNNDHDNNNNNNNNDNNILLNHVGESTTTLSDPSQIKASHEINDLSDFISSWVSMMSQSNYLNNFRLMECFKQSGSLLNLFNCHNIEQFNVDQEKQINSNDTCCRIRQNNSMLNKEKIITNITDNNQFMNNQNIDNCPVNLHANYHPDLMNNYDSELWKVEDFTQYDKDNPMNFTATNLKTSEKLQFKQYCNQDNRPRSPCCECSCHSQFIYESNHPLMHSIQHQINSSHLIDNNNIIEKLRDYSTKQSIIENSDELPTKLHNKRHSINMKRLSEQLTRLNHLNSTGNYSNNNLMFINKYSSINNNNNLTKSNLMKDEQIANHNEDMNRNDYFSAGECKIPLTKNIMLSDSKMASNLNSSTVNTTYNSSRTDNTNMSSLPTLSMSENKCVWMPVPVTMLNSWFNLLSNIKGLNNNSINQSNFMTSSSFSTSSSSTSSSISSASLSSTMNNN